MGTYAISTTINLTYGQLVILILLWCFWHICKGFYVAAKEAKEKVDRAKIRPIGRPLSNDPA